MYGTEPVLHNLIIRYVHYEYIKDKIIHRSYNNQQLVAKVVRL